MDYQVGSLADMISGSANKEKKSKSTPVKDTMKISFEKIQTTPMNNGQSTSKRKSEPSSGTKSKKMKVHFAEENETVAVEKVHSTGAKKRIERKVRNLANPSGPKKIRHVPNAEEESRTIFVGNLEKTVTKHNLKNWFGKYGLVDKVRLRSAAVADPRTPKKVAIITRDFHPDRSNINAYIRFMSVESAVKALDANGMIVKEHTLRVDMAGRGDNAYNAKQAVFVGNVKFTIEEEDLRKVFQSCGKINSIRLIRDNRTGMGKGFAFINFDSTGAAELALKLDGEVLEKRPIRVSRCDKSKNPKKSKKLKIRKRDRLAKKEGRLASDSQEIVNGDGPKIKKRKRENSNPEVEDQDNLEQPKKIKSGKNMVLGEDARNITKKMKALTVAEFQGQETDKKIKKVKKNKFNKAERHKKSMLNKLEVIPRKNKVKKSKIKNNE